MEKQSLFMGKFLLIFCLLAFNTNGQVHHAINKFKNTDFYNFFNFKTQKQNENLEVLKPGAFQEFIELQVYQNQNKIEKMVLTIHQDFINKQRLLAADLLKSFILLHVEENHQDFQNIFEVLSKGDYQKHYGYYLDQMLSVFLSYDGFFIIPFKEQDISLILQNKDFQLVAIFQKNIHPKPIEISNYSFNESEDIKEINKKWNLNLQLKNGTPQNEKTWIDTSNQQYHQITHIQYHFSDNTQARQYFIENFEGFSEKGQVYDPFYKKDKKIFSEYVIVSELNYPELNSQAYILAFPKDKACHKFVMLSDKLDLVDLIDLAKKN